jgi:hypothetical protein
MEIDRGAATRLVGHPLGQLGDGDVRTIDGEQVAVREFFTGRVPEDRSGALSGS